MKGLLLKVLAPLLAIGGLFGAGYSAKKFGFIEQGTWTYVWPSLVAVVLLGLAVLVLLTGARRWLWPLVAGFLAQTVGVLLYVVEALDSPWETLLWTAVVVGAVLLGMGVFYLEVYRRARKTEKGMLEAGLEEGVDPEELEKIRENMLGAIEMMRRAGQGRNAIYQLPWFLVVGRPSAGKTVAIKESGLGLPVKKDWVKGVGGTYSCDFFFTNDLIFMDTPGRWVRDGADDTAKRYWESLLKLLRRYRGRRPLDGLVVVVSVEDLAGGEVDAEDRVKLEDQAANIREIIDLMHDNLNFRFPIYLLVSKVDLITGFTDFFWGIPAQRRHEILGWSNPNPGDLRVEKMIHTGLDSVMGRLQQYRLELLAKLGRKSRNRRLFFFTEELKQIREPLADFARVLFYEDPSRQAPIFRGFYFTSGMQGVGSPVSMALSGLARNLKISQQPSTATAEEEGKRSFFLLELFRELMVGDEGLIGRTAKHWWKQRRNTAFGAFLPAGLALAVLLFSGVSLMWNRSLYREMDRRVPEIVEQLQTAPDGTPLADQELSYETLTKRLEMTEELRTYYRKLTNVNPFRRFGMRRTEELSRETFAVFKRQFSEAVLRPTLKLAQERATTSSCADRVDVFHSVVWMRLGRRFDTSDSNMAGFDLVWSELELEPEERTFLRSELLNQFRYLVKHDPSSNVSGLLAGFQMYPVAEAIKRDCDMAGAGSPLDQFRLFQVSCADADSDDELKQCYDMLAAVANWGERDTDRYLSHIRELQDSLRELKAEESDAEDALELLASMDLGKQEKSQCVSDFVGLLVPLSTFAIRDDLLQQCRDEVSGLATSAEKRQRRTEVINQQVAELTAAADTLKQRMASYSSQCQYETLVPFNIQQLEFATVNGVSYNYRRRACLGLNLTKTARSGTNRPRSAVAYRTVAPSPGGGRSKPAPRSGSRRAAEKTLGPFSGVCTPPSSHRSQGWDANQADWATQFAAAEDPQISAAIQQREKQAVEGAVRGFGSRLSAEWLGCLGKLKLREPETDLAGWLETLSTAPEFVTLLGKPAEDAAAIQATAAAPPFDAVIPGLKPLTDLQEFAATSVPEYQNMLAGISEEMKSIEADAEAFYAYRQAYESGSPDNSLVALKRWLLQNVARKADGKLISMFNQPVQHVERFVNSDQLITAQWQDLVRRYEEGLASRFPFASDKSDPELEVAELPALISLFGFKSGAVHKINAETPELGAEARAWLARAKQYSGVFFKKDTDDPKPLRLTLEPLPATTDNEELQKKYKVAQTIVSLAPATDLKWVEDSDELGAVPFKLELFGEDASQRATLKAWVSERKGKFIRAFTKKDWKEGESIPVAKVEGPWAPVLLLRQGLPEGEQPGGGRLKLGYSAPWSWDKKKQASFELPYGLNGPQLPWLWTLVDQGFAPPPADPAN